MKKQWVSRGGRGLGLILCSLGSLASCSLDLAPGECQQPFEPLAAVKKKVAKAAGDISSAHNQIIIMAELSGIVPNHLLDTNIGKAFWANGFSLKRGTYNGTEERVTTIAGIRLGQLQLGTAPGALPGQEERLAARLEGPRLVATKDSGEELWGQELVGAKLLALTDRGQEVSLRLASVAHFDTTGLSAYALELPNGENLCGDGATGMLVPGVWDNSGARHDFVELEGQRYDATFSCDGGVIAKCARWGYAPWSAGADLHQACTRMARADYCGDGVAHTEDGTAIDVYDDAGIQRPENGEDMAFEAGWGTEGAVCVSKTRYAELSAAGQELLPWCWADKPVCADEAAARQHGAALFNASAYLSRAVCD